MKKEKNESKNYSYIELSEDTGIAVGTLYAMVSKKCIPHYRLGPRHVLFDKNEISKWLNKHRVEVRSR